MPQYRASAAGAPLRSTPSRRATALAPGRRRASRVPPRPPPLCRRASRRPSPRSPGGALRTPAPRDSAPGCTAAAPRAAGRPPGRGSASGTPAAPAAGPSRPAAPSPAARPAARRRTRPPFLPSRPPGRGRARGPLFPGGLRRRVGFPVQWPGHLRRTPQPCQQAVRPALGVRHAVGRLDPPPDLGRRPEPPRGHLVGDRRLLLRRQHGRMPLPAHLVAAELGHAARPVPGRPALDRPVVDADRLGHLLQGPAAPQQPQAVQLAAPLPIPLRLIGRLPRLRRVRRSPLHHKRSPANDALPPSMSPPAILRYHRTGMVLLPEVIL